MKSTALLFLTAAVLLLASCNPYGKSNTGKSVFRYNESAGITSLDPAFARDQANIWADNQLYNGLLQFDEKLKIKPCIARQWELSADGCTYTFHLRTDVYFHDSKAFAGGKGRRVTAGDFVYSLNRLRDPAVASPGAWVMTLLPAGTKENALSAPNDSTLLIRLSKPFPPFAGLLCMQYCSVVPREAVEFYGAGFRQNPVGTGPFRMGMWKEGVKLVLLKNDRYFEKTAAEPIPYLDAVAVTFIRDKQTAFLEFVKGNLDFVSGIDAGYKDEILTPEGSLNPKYSSRVSMTKQPYLNTEYLGIQIDTAMPVSKRSPLKQKLVRQAICCAFDRVKMMRYLRNNIGKPGVYGFVPAGMPWYEQEKIKGYTFDPARTLRLLKQAGYSSTAGLPPITLSTNASYLDLCRFIQSQLSEIGIKVNIDVTPPATLREMMAQGKVEFFRGSWIADYPDAENYLSLFYTPNFCPAGPNYTHFSNAAFDRLYEKSLSESNDSLRAQQYMLMDRIVMEEAPVIVLYYDEVLRFSRKNISGLGSNPLNLLTLKNVKKYD